MPVMIGVPPGPAADSDDSEDEPQAEVLRRTGPTRMDAGPPSRSTVTVTRKSLGLGIYSRAQQLELEKLAALP
jgi:hypothetical protein